MNAVTSLQKCLNVVCDYYGYTKEDFIRRDRKKHLVNARQMFFFIADCFTEANLTEKGDFLDRDHTTVIHSINKIKIEKEIYPEVKEHIRNIESILFKDPPMVISEINLLELTENYTKSFLNNK